MAGLQDRDGAVPGGHLERGGDFDPELERLRDSLRSRRCCHQEQRPRHLGSYLVISVTDQACCLERVQSPVVDIVVSYYIYLLVSIEDIPGVVGAREGGVDIDQRDELPTAAVPLALSFRAFDRWLEVLTIPSNCNNSMELGLVQTVRMG